MKTCRVCKKKLSKTQFDKNPRSADGLRGKCLICRGEFQKDYYKRKTIKSYVRQGFRVPLYQKCIVERTSMGKEIGSGGNKLKGRFIEEYENFFLFETSQGWKECFMKNTIGIDWNVKNS